MCFVFLSMCNLFKVFFNHMFCLHLKNKSVMFFFVFVFLDIYLNTLIVAKHDYILPSSKHIGYWFYSSISKTALKIYWKFNDIPEHHLLFSCSSSIKIQRLKSKTKAFIQHIKPLEKFQTWQYQTLTRTIL